MKNFLVFIVGLVLPMVLTGCKQTIDPVNSPSLLHKSGAKAVGNSYPTSDQGTGFTYYFYVNGVRFERGQQFEVRAGQRFYVELRFSPSNYTSTAIVMDRVTRWDIPTNNIRLIRQYTPEYNNANEYEVIAPNILPGDHLNLGTITAYFAAFPGSSDSERRPVTLSLLQSGGGIEGTLTAKTSVTQ